ncbi:Hypothetical protein UVM_LOCUS272 [uncultured virus]|nr:Hypothetical protein UVM_LOCUS272 [uncultured virus]
MAEEDAATPPESEPWRAYLMRYPDLVKSGIKTREGAEQHWIKHGQREDRIWDGTAEPAWRRYLQAYPDLRAANMRTKAAALSHWRRHGQAEGRRWPLDDPEVHPQASTPSAEPESAGVQTDSERVDTQTDAEQRDGQPEQPSLAWVRYLRRYPDLGEANINTRSGALTHWRSHGKKEGRVWPSEVSQGYGAARIDPEARPTARLFSPAELARLWQEPEQDIVACAGAAEPPYCGAVSTLLSALAGRELLVISRAETAESLVANIVRVGRAVTLRTARLVSTVDADAANSVAVSSKQGSVSIVRHRRGVESSADRQLLREMYSVGAPRVDVMIFECEGRPKEDVGSDVARYGALLRPGGIAVIVDDGGRSSAIDVGTCLAGNTASLLWNTLGWLPSPGSPASACSPDEPHSARSYAIQRTPLHLWPLVNRAPSDTEGVVGLRWSEDDLPVFGIVMATYARKNAAASEGFRGALRSVRCQSYPHWHLFLVGDKHESESSVLEALRECDIPSDKFTWTNLPVACEREYETHPRRLWHTAGATAMNYALELIDASGLLLAAHLDDDDRWLPQHLALCVRPYLTRDASFSYTRGHSTFGLTLPLITGPNDLPPVPERVFHSTVSWRLDRIPLRYNGWKYDMLNTPADADMWDRIADYCATHKLIIGYDATVTVETTCR